MSYTPQVPSCLALILADNIHVCPSTQKRTILGTFTAVFAEQFPTPLNVAVYCCLTDAIGKIRVDVKFVRVNSDEFSDELVAEAHGDIDFPDPLAMIEMNMFFQGLQLTHAGEYRFQVWVADEVLLERRLVVISVQNEENSDPEENLNE